MSTPGGLVDVFDLFFIYLGSRGIHVAGLTTHPDRGWMVQQAGQVSALLADEPLPARILFRDHDTKFVREFDDVFQSDPSTCPITTRSAHTRASGTGRPPGARPSRLGNSAWARSRVASGSADCSCTTRGRHEHPRSGAVAIWVTEDDCSIRYGCRDYPD